MVATPIIKWAGGKRRLAKTLAPRIHARLASTGGRYIEPFLGGAAVALHLGLPRMILGDVCHPLMEMYMTLRNHPRAVSWSLQAFIDRGTDRDSYLYARDQALTSPVMRAARFLYINKLGFNGLHRENRRGRNNVPYGSGKPKFPTPDEIHAVAVALADADLAVRSALETIAQAGPGDVIYADPPYDGTFTAYTGDGFSADDQAHLAVALYDAVTRGAHIVASNNETDRVRDLYAWAWIDTVVEQRRIAAKVEGRADCPTLLIASDEELLG